MEWIICEDGIGLFVIMFFMIFGVLNSMDVILIRVMVVFGSSIMSIYDFGY